MKGKLLCTLQSLPQPFGCALLMGFFLTGCFEQDEQMHGQMAGLRAELKAAQEDAEKTRAELLELRQSDSSEQRDHVPSSDELRAARERIADLERDLAAARAQPAPAAPAQLGMDLNGLRALASQMQKDLTEKVTVLADLVQAQASMAELLDVTVRRIQPPQEIATAFSSSVVFGLRDGQGRDLRLEFPVKAGFDGVWNMPTVEDVKQHYAQAIQRDAAVPQPQPAAAPIQPSSDIATPFADSSGTPTIMVNWGGSAAVPTPSTQPSQAQVPSPLPAPSPPANVPQPGTPAETKVHAPVMPVERDIIIRFD